MNGPRRGLRHPVPVHTHPALTHVVGRTGEPLADGSQPPVLVLGSGTGWEELRKKAAATGAASIARAADIPRRTATDVIYGHAQPTAETMAKIVAVVEEEPDRRCPGCGEPMTGRSDKRWCSDRCRMAAARQASRAALADRQAAVEKVMAELAARIEGISPAQLAASPSVRPTIGDALDAGMSPEELAVTVAAMGPLGTARSPVGALVARIRQLAGAHREQVRDESERRRAGAIACGRRLGRLVVAGSVAPDEAEAEITRAFEPELASVALHELKKVQ